MARSYAKGIPLEQDGLGQYDYGVRFYDPVIGRFNTLEPLSEESRRFSPFSYTMNNPIILKIGFTSTAVYGGTIFWKTK